MSTASNLEKRARSKFICVQSSCGKAEYSFNELVELHQYENGTTAYENWRAHFANNPQELWIVSNGRSLNPSLIGIEPKKTLLTRCKEYINTLKK